MHKLTKAQMERRKKKRERNKPTRHAWRMYFKKVIKEYNERRV